jgi:hypothetical protein
VGLDVEPAQILRDQSMVALFRFGTDFRRSTKQTFQLIWGLATPTNAAVRLATAAVLPNTPVYANGAAGVGATLTAGANSTLTVDGIVANLNDRILVKTQASPFQNGIYTVTAAGSGAAPWVLTRAVEADQAAEVAVDILVLTTAGVANTNKQFLHHGAVIVMGTDAINWEAGEPAGTFTFEESISSSSLTGVADGTWDAITATVASQPAGTAGHTTVTLQSGSKKVRAIYTPTTGTGLCQGYVIGKT